MELTVLGSGTIKTAQFKNCSGYLLNKEILIDCGPGIWRAFGRKKILNSQIKYILISHFHADHVSDLAPFLMERYLLSEDKIKELTIIGPKGLKHWINSFSELFGEWIVKLQLDTIEIDKELKINDYAILALPTFHTDNSICYRIEDVEGKSLCYSGDSDYNENLITIAQNCDVGIFEASNTKETKIAGHLTPEFAAEIAKKSKIKKLILTHYYSEVYKYDPLKKASAIFNGDIIEAHDDLVINF